MTRSWAAREKSRVMLTLMPAAMRRRTATAPSIVPGTLTITFGRFTVSHNRCASAIVPSVSCASCGATSIETKPSAPSNASYMGRNRSHAERTSSVSIASKVSPGVCPAPSSAPSCSSYAEPSDSAFSKIVGLEVIPVRASSRIRRARSPFCRIDRSMKSSQIDCPASCNCWSRFGIGLTREAGEGR